MDTEIIPTSPVIARYWPDLNDLSDNMKLELIILLSNSMRHFKATTPSTNWADRFLGAWVDDRTSDEIVDDIRSMRTNNTFDIEL